MERDNRNLEGKTCIFDSHGQDSQYSQFDGRHCKVINRKDELTTDFEDVGTLWEIDLDGYGVTDAFADELTEITITV